MQLLEKCSIPRLAAYKRFTPAKETETTDYFSIFNMSLTRKTRHDKQKFDIVDRRQIAARPPNPTLLLRSSRYSSCVTLCPT